MLFSFCCPAELSRIDCLVQLCAEISCLTSRTPQWTRTRPGFWTLPFILLSDCIISVWLQWGRQCEPGWLHERFYHSHWAQQSVMRVIVLGVVLWPISLWQWMQHLYVLSYAVNSYISVCVCTVYFAEIWQCIKIDNIIIIIQLVVYNSCSRLLKNCHLIKKIWYCSDVRAQHNTILINIQQMCCSHKRQGWSLQTVYYVVYSVTKQY